MADETAQGTAEMPADVREQLGDAIERVIRPALADGARSLADALRRSATAHVAAGAALFMLATTIERDGLPGARAGGGGDRG